MSFRSGVLAYALALFLFLAGGGGTTRGQGSEGTSDPVVARAGKRFISEEEFVRRFEFIPGLYRHIPGRMNEEKLIVMYSLIAEKLMAQEAEMRGIDQDSATVRGIQTLTGLLARDELYRREIARPVEVTAEELRRGITNSLRKLFVTYLVFRNEEDARFVDSQLGKKTLLTYGVDSSMQALKDTSTILWGMAERPMEEAAFALNVGGRSPVTVTSQGFLILELTREERNQEYGRMAPAVRTERVARKIRLRKEEARLTAFMNDFLPGQTGYARPRSIKTLAIALAPQLVQNDSTHTIDQEALGKILERLRPGLDDTVMVAGTRIWRVRDVVARLFQSGFTFTTKDPLGIANRLTAECRIWVEQELLAQEALRRGLDRTPEVQRQLRQWNDSYLAQLMRVRIEDSVAVSDADVYGYLEKYGQPLPTPRVQVRELLTRSIDDMQRAITDLGTQVPFEEVVRRYSSDPLLRDRGGLTDFFKISEHPPVGEIAGQMAIGDMYGPFRVSGGMLLFQLIDRRDSVSGDTSLVLRKREAAGELLRLKRKSVLEQFIARSAATNGFTVFEDRLRALKVSPVPMMAFRVLGFGGRMFAAPMLPSLYEWINVDVRGIVP